MVRDLGWRKSWWRERELGWRESSGGERVGMREIGGRNLDLGWKTSKVITLESYRVKRKLQWR